MKTQKIKLTELRQLVKEIIKEEKVNKRVIKENKIFFDYILQGSEATEENAMDVARGLDWQEIETKEANYPNLSYVDTVNGVGIYYNYGTDDYYFTDESLEEGLWNQLKTGAKSAFGAGIGSGDRTGGGLNLGKRFNAAKTGFQQQGKVDNIDKVLEVLKPLVDSGKIDPNQTVAQLLNSAGKFQKGSLGQMKAQAKSRISKTQNDIYRK